MKKCVVLLFCLLTGSMTAHAETLAEQLYGNFDSLAAVTCEIRRDVSSAGGRVRWLSRIAYAKPDRLYVQNSTPLPRLIIADGITMYQLVEKQPRGFRRAIADLDEIMLQNLRRVPGTPMDHLVRLLGLPEIALEGGDEWPLRRAYETDRVYVVLHADAEKRLQRIEIAPLTARDQHTAVINFRNQEEVWPGVWVAMLQESQFRVGEIESQETLRVSSFIANPESAPDQFDPSAHLPSDVEWVDRFEDLVN